MLHTLYKFLHAFPVLLIRDFSIRFFVLFFSYTRVLNLDFLKNIHCLIMYVNQGCVDGINLWYNFKVIPGIVPSG
jgi:hypothetical protein